MTVVFRADASAQIGTGHVMRCLALAEALRRCGAQPRFICRERQGHLMATLRERSFPVTALPDSPTTTPEDDARDTIDALRGIDPDWMVVDHYGLDAAWERCVRPKVGRLLVIDDLANRHHDCHLLLDQNYSLDGERRYASLVSESCTILIGPRYALLAEDYAKFREANRRRIEGVRRVLVYFGGADLSDVTGQALEALSALEFSHLTIDVVIGASYPYRDALEAKAAGRPDTHVHGTRPHLADLMAVADLAIGAGGVTTWERMCLGLPALVVSIADNQRATSEALATAGLIQYVGDLSSVEAADIRKALAQLVDDRERLTELAFRGQALVDGRGASRVADIMLGPTVGDLVGASGI